MKTLIARHKAGEHIGICSVCSAHPLVIEAALAFDRNSTRKVLIEATSNQVNQFGGYTGMTPADFREFVFAIADKVGFARERIILGGDHLGPNCWQQENADAAMEKSVELVKAYVRAGFSKIHLDASMSCADDSIPLAPETVAERAAVLCLAAESVATDCQREQLNYVIGTEVPVPGGEASAIQSVHITQVEDAANTLRTHQKAFIARGLAEALTRVIAIVVQPGVEFDHSNIIHYQAQEAQALAQWIEKTKMLGHTAVVSASLIFIPLTILIAVCVPGNQVLPFGDLATIGFFVAMAVAVHRGNLFRTLISGVIIMSITLWIATQTIGLHTQLAANAGALKAGGMVASMDQGGSPITWLLIQVFSPQNIPGFIIIGAIYLTGIFMTWRRARGFIKQEKVVLAE
ncbi:TPA: class II D-tagatose-bisphosphate aldolase, non-catalytic subunit [Escherichia coli]|uniref:class II D-tagatose-bisphosphate aldolase non-catalytic subunit n=1 Tax=Escherichia coli TaxID=562 RepID=UPI00301D5202